MASGKVGAAGVVGAARSLHQYSQVAQAASSAVIRGYSTSFGLATRLLGKRVRQDVVNIYALVRVADEVVDGTALAAVVAAGEVAGEVAGESAEAAAAERAPSPNTYLTELENQTYAALECGYSTDLVVHAFAQTARRVGLGRELVEPFFASMRMDLTVTRHDAESLRQYIYGSAEVVGLMCLRAFTHGQGYSVDELAQLDQSGRALGAAFQKINFLRDLAADKEGLGREYFAAFTDGQLTEASKAAIITDIYGDLAIAAFGVRKLPRDCRRAVAAATLLFTRLTRKLAATPAAAVQSSRVRVSNPVKAAIALGCWLGRLPK